MSKKSALYFKNLNGYKIIECNDCRYKEEVFCNQSNSILMDGSSEIKKGVQCQSCGKFSQKSYSIDYYERKVFPMIDLSDPLFGECECRGKIERDNPLFCPKCKSNFLSFK